MSSIKYDKTKQEVIKEGYRVEGNKLVGGSRGDFYIHLTLITGSRAYGTDTPESDTDIKGVFIQPLESKELYGPISTIEIDKDTVYYELRRFLFLASSGNPTILEMLFSNDECILHISESFRDTIYKDSFRNKFITKLCKNSYTGYAIEQIKKAGGLEKKMNFEKDGYFSVKKDVMDFCYAFNPNLGVTEPVKDLLKRRNPRMRNQENYGLTKCKNMVNAFFVYYFDESMEETPKGFIKPTSTELRTTSVPKGMKVDFIIQFNHGAYKEHQKKYGQYQTWLKERNTQRYVDSETHGQKVDGKNLMHCVRLLDTAEDLASGKGLIVKRSNPEYLISIRKGKVVLDSLLKECEKRVEVIDELFLNSDLPETVPDDIIVDVKRKLYGI